MISKILTLTEISRRAAEPAESATKIVSNFFQNGGQFERLFNNQIYGIN